MPANALRASSCPSRLRGERKTTKPRRARRRHKAAPQRRGALADNAAQMESTSALSSRRRRSTPPRSARTCARRAPGAAEAEYRFLEPGGEGRLQGAAVDGLGAAPCSAVGRAASNGYAPASRPVAARFERLPAPAGAAINRALRTGGRVAEGARLERVYGCKPIEGSNPSLSARAPSPPSQARQSDIV